MNYFFAAKTAASLLATLALSLVSAQNALADTITFEGASRATDFSHYVEGGFSVDATAGNWFVSGYGHPGQSVQFLHSRDEAPTFHTLSVANGGALFKFSSLDLYSSVTVIPYTINGYRNNTQVFSFSGEVPYTFGNFITVDNAFADQAIDRLAINLTNPDLFVSSNPIGVDSIVTSPVPEPETWGMLVAGLCGLAALRRRKRASH